MTAAVSRHTAPIAAVLAALAGALVSLGAWSLVSHPHPAAHDAAAFHLTVPMGWSRLDSLPAGAVAGFRRADHRGLVVVRRTAPVRATGNQLAGSLGRTLRRRFPGFEPVSARVVTIRAGRAFTYTFTRDPGHTVQSLTLVGLGGQAYAIDAVAPADAPAVARQIGAMVTSFGG